MTLPREAQLLGASSAALEVKGSGADTVVRLQADAQRKLVKLISSTSTGEFAGALYLGLENVRGTFDAAVLNTYINLPTDARPADHPDLRAESVALYGLRRASMPQGETQAEGLTFLLDITPILVRLIASKSFHADELRVTLIPDRPLPESVTIVVGRISIFSA